MAEVRILIRRYDAIADRPVWQWSFAKFTKANQVNGMVWSFRECIDIFNDRGYLTDGYFIRIMQKGEDDIFVRNDDEMAIALLTI
jgi:hypothetical protein